MGQSIYMGGDRVDGGDLLLFRAVGAGVLYGQRMDRDADP